jgi:hypothetical protein
VPAAPPAAAPKPPAPPALLSPSYEALAVALAFIAFQLVVAPELALPLALPSLPPTSVTVILAPTLLLLTRLWVRAV